MAKHTSFEHCIVLEDINPVDFYGVNNEKINLLKDAYPDVKFIARGNELKTLGDPEKLEALSKVINIILTEIRHRGDIDSVRMSQLIHTVSHGVEHEDSHSHHKNKDGDDIFLHGTNGLLIRLRTAGQKLMAEKSQQNDIVFATGPAGTGKTYSAVAIAVKALKEKRVKKIVLVRPAVEAGESLGFLPGDLKEKIDPYLRPLYDALEDMIVPEKLKTYLERNIIEIAPLAYMRGRTLNHAFVILDEAQNATEMQLKMFLTRLGMESKIIVTGDETQIDLPRKERSGLIQCLRILQDISGIGFVRLNEHDVVRHKLVKSIILAYEKLDQESDRS